MTAGGWRANGERPAAGPGVNARPYTLLRLRTSRYAVNHTARPPLDRFDEPETLQLMEFVEVVLGQIVGLDPFGTAVVDFPYVVVEGRQPVVNAC